jgi:hypothetical protein
MKSWRKKPKEVYCENHCSLYPCKRTECDRRRLIVDGDIIMAPANVCDEWDDNMTKYLKRDYAYKLREF